VGTFVSNSFKGERELRGSLKYSSPYRGVEGEIGVLLDLTHPVIGVVRPEGSGDRRQEHCLYYMLWGGSRDLKW